MLSALTGVSIPVPHSYSDLRRIATEFEALGFFDMEDLVGADVSFVDGITAFDSRVKLLAKGIVERASVVGAQASSGASICVCFSACRVSRHRKNNGGASSTRVFGCIVQKRRCVDCDVLRFWYPRVCA